MAGLAGVVISGVLLVLHARKTWPAASLGGGLTGLAYVITAFVLVGVAAAVPVSPALWVGMTPTFAVWIAITAAAMHFILGVLVGGPWFVTAMLREADSDVSVERTVGSR